MSSTIKLLEHLWGMILIEATVLLHHYEPDTDRNIHTTDSTPSSSSYLSILRSAKTRDDSNESMLEEMRHFSPFPGLSWADYERKKILAAKGASADKECSEDVDTKTSSADYNTYFDRSHRSTHHYEPDTDRNIHTTDSTPSSGSYLSILRRYNTFENTPLLPKKQQQARKKEEISKVVSKPKVTAYPTVNGHKKRARSCMDSERHNEMNRPKDMREQIADERVGELVWVKFGLQYWPAIIIQAQDGGQRPVLPGHTWVYWFGDHRISKVLRNDCLPYLVEFIEYHSHCKKKLWNEALKESLMVLADLKGFTAHQNDLTCLINWAKSICPKSNSGNTQLHAVFCSAAGKVRSGILDIESVCIGCDSLDKEIKVGHPLFHGGLCDRCRIDIVENMFAFGNDGKVIFCSMCGESGKLFICDNDKCNRCFCEFCIRLWASPDAEKKVIAMDPWFCFFCNADDELNGLIRPHTDWEKRVISFFKLEWEPNLEQQSLEKGPIRVLSFFDGIGTGQLEPGSAF